MPFALGSRSNLAVESAQDLVIAVSITVWAGNTSKYRKPGSGFGRLLQVIHQAVVFPYSLFEEPDIRSSRAMDMRDKKRFGTKSESCHGEAIQTGHQLTGLQFHVSRSDSVMTSRQRPQFQFCMHSDRLRNTVLKTVSGRLVNSIRNPSLYVFVYSGAARPVSLGIIEIARASNVGGWMRI
jgi:hypothetical protein